MQKLGKVFFYVWLVSLILSQSVSAASYGWFGDSLKARNDSARKAARHANKTTNQQQQGLQPVIRLGAGMLSYIGNVKSGAGSTNFQSPATGRPGYDFGLSIRLSTATEFGLNFLYGTLAETERTTDATWNFKSTIAGGGFNLMFKILPKQDVTPYILIGVETYGFSSNADIYDPNGNEYYTWSDGTLRSLPQNSPNAASAKILNLDYNYSTDIRSLNLDGSGNYNQQTFAIPVGIGFMFRLATCSDFMIGSTLHYTFTDHIDGLTPQVQGPLQGTLSHDMFLFTYISVRIHLTKDRSKPEPAEEVNISPDMMNDTVHPAAPAHFDTSETVLQKQYELYSDTSGKFAKVHVDPFQWKVANPVSPAAADNGNVTNNTSGNNKSSGTNKPSISNNTSGTSTKKGGNANPTKPPASSNNTNVTPGTTIYKIQLLATSVKLPDGVNFAGTNDQTAVTKTDKGLYLYTTGNFTSYSEALKYLNQLKAFGYSDAFIRTTKSGNDVPANPGHTFNDKVKQLPNQPQSDPASQDNVVSNATASAVTMTAEKKKD